MSRKHGRSVQSQGNQSTRIVAHKQEFFAGPLPHPNILQKFEEVVPGSAARIIDWAENQTTHRQALEKRVIASDIFRANSGLICALVIALSGMWLGYLLIKEGFEITGSLFAGTTLLSLVTTFIYGSQSRRKERENRRAQS
jgi:uncharacterized membrane protein